MDPYRKNLSENPNLYLPSFSFTPCPAAIDLRFQSLNQASNRPSPTPKLLGSAIYYDQIQKPSSKDKNKTNSSPTKGYLRFSEVSFPRFPTSIPNHGGSPSLTCPSDSKIYGRIGWDIDRLYRALIWAHQKDIRTDPVLLLIPRKRDGLPKADERGGSGWRSIFGSSKQISSLRHVWWSYWILWWWLFPWHGSGPLGMGLVWPYTFVLTCDLMFVGISCGRAFAVVLTHGGASELVKKSASLGWLRTLDLGGVTPSLRNNGRWNFLEDIFTYARSPVDHPLEAYSLFKTPLSPNPTLRE